MPPRSLPDAPAPGTLLLDAGRVRAGDRSARALLFERPRRVLQAVTPDEVPGVLQAWEAALADGHYVAGYLAYEAGTAWASSAAPPSRDGPLAWFGVYDAPRDLGDELEAWLAAHGATAPFAASQPRFALARDVYADRIQAIKHQIREGNVYQINFTAPVFADLEGAPLALYAALRQTQAVSYGAYLRPTADRHVLCRSPELFFRRRGDLITARPMKGTSPRGHSPADDAARQAALAADAKNQAENLMIVDLLRNDLSVCCEPGTVRVPALFDTEVYDTVIQMTSTVEGRLREGISYGDLFRALFPCGSITGAPKRRAMEVIRTLEARPRGVYCGTIGYAAPDGTAAFNVAIRTLDLRAYADGSERFYGVMGVGSGIVWDSDPDSEYEECLLKAAFLERAVAPALRPRRLIETMRWEDGHIALLDLHADRLAASARRFGYPFDADAWQAAIADVTRSLPAARVSKVRATLGADGDFAITTAPVTPVAPERLVRVGLASHRADSADPAFHHKTTDRSVYEAAYAEARARGWDEALLRNERGEVTEGTRTNVLVRRGDAYVTPPLGAGLLGGVYRRHLLDAWPHLTEQALRPDDLLRADAVYLCNAIWGLREAVFVGAGDSG